MGKIIKHEMEVSADQMIIAAIGVLEKFYGFHKKTAVEKLFSIKLFDQDYTVAELVNDMFKIVKPVIERIRKRFPTLFAVIDWAQDIVMKLMDLR